MTVPDNKVLRVGIQLPEVEREVRWPEIAAMATLAEDVGAAIGCGAHVSMLRRLQVGPFVSESMLTFEQLEARAEEGADALEALLLPLDRALEHCPPLELERNSAFYLRQGQAVLVPRAPTEGLVRLYDPSRRFIGVGETAADLRPFEARGFVEALFATT